MSITIKLFVDPKGAASGLKQAERQFRQTASRIDAQSAKIRSGLLATTAALGGLGLAVKSFIDSASDLEEVTVQYETLTGSVVEARRAIQGLLEFSATTPFQFDSIAQAGRVLLSAGVAADRLTERLGTLGDIAAVTGAPLKDLATIFAQVNVEGKLTTERLNQFLERGINIAPAVAEAFRNIGRESELLGKSIKKLAEEGKITFDIFDLALNTLNKEGGLAFEGMLKQSRTLKGLLSTLKDRFKLLAIGIGERFLPGAKKAVAALSDFVKVLSESQVFQDNAARVLKLTGLMLALRGIYLGAALTLLYFKRRLAGIPVTIAATNSMIHRSIGSLIAFAKRFGSLALNLGIVYFSLRKLNFPLTMIAKYFKSRGTRAVLRFTASLKAMGAAALSAVFSLRTLAGATGIGLLIVAVQQLMPLWRALWRDAFETAGVTFRAIVGMAVGFAKVMAGTFTFDMAKIKEGWKQVKEEYFQGWESIKEIGNRTDADQVAIETTNRRQNLIKQLLDQERQMREIEGKKLTSEAEARLRKRYNKLKEIELEKLKESNQAKLAQMKQNQSELEEMQARLNADRESMLQDIYLHEVRLAKLFGKKLYQSDLQRIKDRYKNATTQELFEMQKKIKILQDFEEKFRGDQSKKVIRKTGKTRPDERIYERDQVSGEIQRAPQSVISSADKIDAAADNLRKAGKELSDKSTPKIKEATERIKEASGGMKEAGQSVGEEVHQKFEQAGDEIKDSAPEIKDAAEESKNFVISVFESMKSAFRNMFDDDAVDRSANKLKDAGKDISENIQNAAKSLDDAAKNPVTVARKPQSVMPEAEKLRDDYRRRHDPNDIDPTSMSNEEYERRYRDAVDEYEGVSPEQFDEGGYDRYENEQVDEVQFEGMDQGPTPADLAEFSFSPEPEPEGQRRLYPGKDAKGLVEEREPLMADIPSDAEMARAYKNLYGDAGPYEPPPADASYRDSFKEGRKRTADLLKRVRSEMGIEPRLSPPEKKDPYDRLMGDFFKSLDQGTDIPPIPRMFPKREGKKKEHPFQFMIDNLESNIGGASKSFDRRPQSSKEIQMPRMDIVEEYDYREDPNRESHADFMKRMREEIKKYGPEGRPMSEEDQRDMLYKMRSRSPEMFEGGDRSPQGRRESRLLRRGGLAGGDIRDIKPATIGPRTKSLKGESSKKLYQGKDVEGLVEKSEPFVDDIPEMSKPPKRPQLPQEKRQRDLRESRLLRRGGLEGGDIRDIKPATIGPRTKSLKGESSKKLYPGKGAEGLVEEREPLMADIPEMPKPPKRRKSRAQLLREQRQRDLRVLRKARDRVYSLPETEEKMTPEAQKIYDRMFKKNEGILGELTDGPTKMEKAKPEARKARPQVKEVSAQAKGKKPTFDDIPHMDLVHSTATLLHKGTNDALKSAYQKSGDLIKKASQEAGGGLSSVWDRIKSVGKTVKDSAVKAGGAIKEASKGAGVDLDKVWDRVKEVGGNVADAAKEAGGALKDSAVKAGGAIKEASKGAGVDLDKVWDRVKEVGGNVVDAAKESSQAIIALQGPANAAMKDGAKKVGEAIKDASKEAGVGLDEVWKRIKEVGGNVADAAKEAGGALKDSAVKAGGAIKEASKGAGVDLDKVWDRVKEVGGNVAEAAKEAGTALSAVHTAARAGLNEDARKAGREMKKSAKEAGIDLDKAWKTIKDVSGDVKENLGEAGSFIIDIHKDAGRVFMEDMGRAGEKLEEFSEIAGEKIGEMSDAAGEKLGEAGDKIKEAAPWLSDAAKSAKDFIVGTYDSIKSAFRDMFSQSEVDETAEKIRSAGRDAGESIKTGAESLSTAATEAVRVQEEAAQRKEEKQQQKAEQAPGAAAPADDGTGGIFEDGPGDEQDEFADLYEVSPEEKLEQKRAQREREVEEEQTAAEAEFERFAQRHEWLQSEEAKNARKMAEIKRAAKENYTEQELADNTTEKERVALHYSETEEQLREHYLRTQGMRAEETARYFDNLKKREKAQDDYNKKNKKQISDHWFDQLLLDKGMSKEKVKIMKKGLNEMIRLQDSSNNTIATIGKAAAIVQIGIDTVQAAMTVYAAALLWFKALGPAAVPLATAAAGAVYAYGAIKASEIADFDYKKAIGLQKGGLIGRMPGTPATGDHQPFLLEPGELVIPRQDVKLVREAATKTIDEEGGADNFFKEDAEETGFKVILGFEENAASIIAAQNIADREIGIGVFQDGD